MKSKLIMVGLMVILALSLLACSAPPPKQVSVDEAYAGKEVEINAVDTLVVTLVSNPSTGFRWVLSGITDPTVLKQDGESEYLPPEGELLGASGKDVWTFKALKKGTSIISMEFSRPWEGGEERFKMYNLTVIVK